MLSRVLRLLVLVAAAGLSNAGAGPAWAQDDELEAMATALKDATFSLQDALKAGEREGQPISGQFEIDDGKLQISIYTTKGDDFSEVVADPKTWGKTTPPVPISNMDFRFDPLTGHAREGLSVIFWIVIWIFSATGSQETLPRPPTRHGWPRLPLTLPTCPTLSAPRY